jgi:hypothetical protein
MKVRDSTRATSDGSERQVGAGLLGVAQREGARGDQLLAEALVLLLGPVGEDHAVRLGQRGDLLDPGQ